eukprot:701323_1
MAISAVYLMLLHRVFFLRYNINDSTKSWNRWVCYNCGNHNFCKYMNGSMTYTISKCSLCGKTQTDSLICKIQKRRSFFMSNEIKNTLISDADDVKHNEMDD